MSRDYDLYLRDILMAITRIERYLDGIEENVFKTNDIYVDAVLFNLMTIGEAIKHLPDRVRDENPEIRWRDIGRFRDRVVHHYFSLDLDVVWDIISVHLPPLRARVEHLLQTPDNKTTE